MMHTRLMVVFGLGALVGCDGFSLDESQFESTFFDADGDGVSRFSVDGLPADCDDTNPEISPRQPEICDGIDNNCDELVDLPPAVDALNALTEHWADADGDGFGDPRSDLLRACEQPEGYVRNYDDCDDLSAAVSPDVVEVCDGIDNDCNAIADDVSSEEASATYFRDADADGFGTADDVLPSCELSPPAGYADNDADCDDTNPYVRPGEGTVEVSRDGVDQNCDGEDDCTDLDCDGQPDLALGYADDWVLPWFTSAVDTSLGSLTVLVSKDEAALELGETASTTDIWVGDVDGDGYKDIIRAVGDGRYGRRDSFASELHLGPFDPEHVDYPGASASVVELDAQAASRVAVGDFDGNGELDLVLGGPTVPDQQLDGTSVFMNASAVVAGGSTSLDSDLEYNTEVVHALIVEDFDGDGYDDLAVCHGPDRDRLLAWGGGAFVAHGSETGLASDAMVTPLDVEGCSDLAYGTFAGSDGTAAAFVVVQGYAGSTATPEWASPVVIEVNDGRAFSSASPLLDVGLSHTVRVLDVDGDGDEDLLFATGFDSGIDESDSTSWGTTLQVVENQGGLLQLRDDLDLTSRGGMFPLAARFDAADDRLDLVAPGHDNVEDNDRPTMLHLQSGGPLDFANGRPLSDLPEWIHGTPYDVTGDGHLDVLAVRAPPEGGVILIEGSEDGLTETWEVIQPGLTASVPPIVVE